MESFKKFISLNQAAQFSGYSQDYLGFLIRKGEIKGAKKGRSWFTTEEEVKNYLFKKKVQHKEFAIKDFFSPTRTKNIIITAIIILIGGFLVSSFISKEKISSEPVVESAVTSDGEGVNIKVESSR
jgi:hypothetical protein